MIHFFLDEAGQLDLKAHLRDIPEVVNALAGVLCDGFPQRISYEPRVHGSPDPRLPYDTTAQDAADVLQNELASWVRHVMEHRGLLNAEVGGNPLVLAAWLERNVTSLAMTPGSEEAPRYVGQAVKQARRAARMSARPETWRLGSTHVARSTLLHASAIALAAKELGPDYERLDRKRVNNLHRLGHIVAVRDNADGLPLFRLGDVMDAHREARSFRKGA
jgi:hypothetical protein